MYTFEKTPLSELNDRMNRFKKEMNRYDQTWEVAVVFSKVNLLYFTGCMQDGMLVITKNGQSIYWVRRSFERAVEESMFPEIRPMRSLKDAADDFSGLGNTVHIEADVMPMALFERIKAYYAFENYKAADSVISKTRSVKSEYELNLTRISGKIHKEVLEDVVPGILKEGMSELDFAVEVYSEMIKRGHQGVSRFAMFDMEMGIGHVCFGESSIYPTYFNGPGGHYGMSPAVPFLANRDNKLKFGDLVFLDVGCGYNGYHTDKTMTYMFGKKLDDEIIRAHKECFKIQMAIASMLKPGNIPEDIYNKIIDGLNEDFLHNFMGYGKRTVKFLGHGIGLHIDEYPVIARGFTEPLEKNMVLAVEPKKGFKGKGMVGVENTFIVTDEGGELITGKNEGLILV